jgi:Ca-activated chloride channel homolog
MLKLRLLALFAAVFIGNYANVYAQSDDDLIVVESSIVVLNATISDKSGQPILGLKANQFKIFEDGVEQKVEIFETPETPFAAIILLDTSGSMEQRISMARSAAINFLGGLRAADNVAIYNFDSKVSLVQPFSNSRDVIPQFYDLKADGWTVLNDAVFEASAELQKRAEKRRAIVILSDGADNKSGRSSSKALKAAIDAGITIYAVDMADQSDRSSDKMINQRTLKNFAEKTGGLFLATPGGVAMREAFKNIVDELGVQYTLAYTSSNLKKDGKWRELEVKVNRPNLKIRTREGYNAPKQK